MVLYWILRWQIPDLISQDIYNVVFHIGFVMILILPLSILLIKKNHFLTIFILYVILIDFYFISFDKEFKYLVDVGVNGCIGYDEATEYPVVSDPGICKRRFI